MISQNDLDGLTDFRQLLEALGHDPDNMDKRIRKNVTSYLSNLRRGIQQKKKKADGSYYPNKFPVGAQLLENIHWRKIGESILWTPEGVAEVLKIKALRADRDK